MASQAAIFAETIAGMKRAAKRKAYESDSDSSIEHLSNRGNKLRKKARYVHEGQLAPPTGPSVYRRRIEHAGFHRDIISRNPPLIDEDGYDVDSEDDDDRAHAAIAMAAELDPYADVRIEHLLTPLTAASDLPDHPTLSKPFKSKTLTELTRQAGEMAQKERASLWRIKHLLTKLSGDHTWVPCEMVETENDIVLFGNEFDRPRGQHDSKVDEEPALAGEVLMEDVNDAEVSKNPELDGVEKEVETSEQQSANGISEKDNAQTLAPEAAETKAAHESEDVFATAGEQEKAVENPEVAKNETAMDLDSTTGDMQKDTDGQDEETADSINADMLEEEDEDAPAPSRMRTRAQANAASDNTPTSRTRSMTPESDIFIHPYFLAPQSSRPDRDFGLPQLEAEELRRLLQLYIQKQEEVCRGAQKVYDGLLKADRCRLLVMKWAKAEAHVGPNADMSDGEDWYDKEEWGLDEDLKKGQDEEEEDAATTAKKTRTRRQ
ncbi:hypothetical protein BP5796_08058 [Coleophoma crateriformis]|uniref:Transcriptional regulatory protein RXT2 N-terminal domain-containing protein n=1 Tax=Coleophoma crateriformis TaxID=565419 RepID=A0A3D8RDT0_9HELO|nr:hypothetical protein BP5796_08058 [Coleophoma crateriformis]